MLRICSFNLDDDISESTDLISIKPKKFQYLKGKLHKWLTKINAQYPTINVNFK